MGEGLGVRAPGFIERPLWFMIHGARRSESFNADHIKATIRFTERIIILL